MARLLKFLHHAVQTVKPVTFEALLRQHFAEGGRPPTPGRFYPSGLDGVCPRAAALQFIGVPVTPVSVNVDLQFIFGIGSAVHDWLQTALTEIAKKRGMTFESEVAIPPTNNPWFVSGRVDGVLVQSGYRMGLEIKTINNAQFNRLYSGPQEKHRFQATIYWGLVQPKLDAMHVFYFNKDNSQLKEFPLTYSPSLFQEAMTKIEDILLALQRGVLPPRIRPDCKDPQCVFREACWSDAMMQEAMTSAATQTRLAAFIPVYRVSGDCGTSGDHR